MPQRLGETGTTLCDENDEHAVAADHHARLTEDLHGFKVNQFSPATDLCVYINSTNMK